MERMKPVDAVLGLYDIIAIHEDNDWNAVRKKAAKNIPPMDGVVRRVNCLSVHVHCNGYVPEQLFGFLQSS